MTEDLEQMLSRLGDDDDPPALRGVDVNAVARRVAARRRRRTSAVAAALGLIVAVPVGWVAVRGADGPHTAPVAPAAPTAPTPTTSAAPTASTASTTPTALAAECPALTTPGEAPPAPPRDLELNGRLVPAQAPTSITLCRYDYAAGDAARELTGTQVIGGDLGRLVGDLREVAVVSDDRPPDCYPPAATTPYRLRLTYPEGTVWVSAMASTEGCAYPMETTSNGERTFAHLGNDLEKAYSTRGWTGFSNEPCAAPVWRRGTAQQLVPDGVTSATVCSMTSPGPPYRTRTVAPNELPTLVRALSAMPSTLARYAGQDPSAACGGTGGTMAPTQVVVLDYARGPAVAVRLFPTCEPEASNGPRQATLTSQVRTLLNLR